MGNLFTGNNYVPVNAGSINAVIANSTLVNPKAGEAEQDTSSRTTLEVTSQIPWENRIVSYGIRMNTSELSGYLWKLASQAFDDVISGYVEYNAQYRKIIGTLYFAFNGAKKSDKGLLAFKSINSEVPDNIVDQYLMRQLQQKNGNSIMTKEAMDIFSDLIYLPNGVNRADPKWPTKIKWDSVYADVVKFGYDNRGNPIPAYRLSGIDMTRVLNMLISSKEETVTKENGKVETVSRKVETVIKPGQPIPGSIERSFDIIIYDVERAKTIINELTGSNAQLYGGSNFVSYTLA